MVLLPLWYHACKGEEEDPEVAEALAS